MVELKNQEISQYNDLAIFINKANERRFNDALMMVIIIEIQLKSLNFNEDMILPRYFNKSVKYLGEIYERSAFIKDLVNKKIIGQIKKLIETGSSMDFKNTAAIKNWISKETGINNCSMSSLY